MSPRSATLLDLDGTLIGLNPLGSELEDLRYALIELGRKYGLTFEHHGIFKMYRDLARYKGVHHAACREARRILDLHEGRWALERAVALCSTEALLDIRAQGHILGIVTSNGRACLDALFRRGILHRELFSATITRDDVTAIKPDPEPLVRACALLKERFHTATIRFIGDSDDDALAAEGFKLREDAPLSFLRVAEWRSTWQCCGRSE